MQSPPTPQGARRWGYCGRHTTSIIFLVPISLIIFSFLFFSFAYKMGCILVWVGMGGSNEMGIDSKAIEKAGYLLGERLYTTGEVFALLLAGRTVAITAYGSWPIAYRLIGQMLIKKSLLEADIDAVRATVLPVCSDNVLAYEIVGDKP